MLCVLVLCFAGECLRGRRWPYRANMEAILSVASLAAAAAVQPVSVALPIQQTVARDQQTPIKLVANVPIPDADELNWPVHVVDPAGRTVAHVRIEFQNLWHEYVSDLRCNHS